MNADDIPTEVTKLAYTCPLSISKAVSQNQVAELLAHYWPAIEKHIREQVAEEIETHPGPIDGEWMDSRDRIAAAQIARRNAYPPPICRAWSQMPPRRRLQSPPGTHHPDRPAQPVRSLSCRS